MSKFPQPFYRDDRRRWYVQLGKKQVNLGPDEAQAWVEYRRVMHERDAPPPLAHPGQSPLVSSVLDAYLEWCQKHRSKLTYQGHLGHCQRFLKSLSDRKSLTVAQLTAERLEDWASAKRDGRYVWGPTYRRNAIGSVKCAFAWAVEAKLVDHSPVQKVKRPEAARNRKAVTPEQFQLLLAVAKKSQARDVLVMLWETGMRPQELRTLEARHVELDRQRIFIPLEEAKGRKHNRVVLLTPVAMEVVARLVAVRPDGALLLNVRGKPWTSFAFNNLFQRLCAKVGFHASAYLFRHGFATRLLKANEGPATVAALMGHRDATMVMKVYQHVGDDADHLRDALNRASGA